METSTATTDKTYGPRWLRRVARVVAVLLVLLAMALTPPLLNVNRLQHRIVTSMSESLGRPVHLDRVSLHLLPVPGFTLENLVVSEDPAFGSEPVIRANVVTVRLRLSSLWRRQVEVSNIKFEVDGHGSGPSMNVVRNRQGRWNLESLLMRASQIETAPTAQTKAGPAPRFPYIEATNARVNLKLGDEKMPFSLTDADFALWLPSPQQWRVRLEAKPARTDTSIHDAGTVRLEGSLDRAPDMADVPVALHASWHEAPLGDASRVVTGDDRNWRGTLTLDASLVGKLSAASFTSSVTLNDLRRADFVPAAPLDLTLACAGVADVSATRLNEVACSLPNATPEAIHISAAGVDLQRLQQTKGTAVFTAFPLESLLNWVQLFSPRAPAGIGAGGTVSGSILRSFDSTATYTGDLLATLPADPATLKPSVLHFTVVGAAAYPGGSALLSLQLSPYSLPIDGSVPPQLSGGLDTTGYAVHVDGPVSADEIRKFAGLLPPLTDDLDDALPQEIGPPEQVHVAHITCTRAWNGPQQCGAATVTAPVRKLPRKHR